MEVEGVRVGIEVEGLRVEGVGEGLRVGRLKSGACCSCLSSDSKESYWIGRCKSLFYPTISRKF